MVGKFLGTTNTKAQIPKYMEITMTQGNRSRQILVSVNCLADYGIAPSSIVNTRDHNTESAVNRVLLKKCFHWSEIIYNKPHNR